MYLPRLRRRAKWVFLLLAVFFAFGLVAFGVGAGGSAVAGGSSTGTSAAFFVARFFAGFAGPASATSATSSATWTRPRSGRSSSATVPPNASP